jgi:uncharacterized membrane protein YebE (DUF533 family)
MYSNRFIELKENYAKERNLKLSEEQFAAIVYTFPSILIANADGRIDLNEKKFMRILPAVMTEGVEGEDELNDVQMTDDYFKEVKYIVSNLEKWEESFLDALKTQLEENLNERNAIFQTMWRTADSSEDISEAERHKIDEVARKLGL